MKKEVKKEDIGKGKDRDQIVINVMFFLMFLMCVFAVCAKWIFC